MNYYHMNVIAIVVYDRLENIRHWLHCWNQCEQDATLVIIHTGPEQWDLRDCIYIHRPNIGFDIGAFQDVCRNRLVGFPSTWEKLLWITDDTFPMQKDFAKQFWNSLTGNTTCVAMEISPYVKRHIRTTGFAVTRYLAERLEFPADPVTTKAECYSFEHRGYTLLDQITRLNFRSIMVAAPQDSPLFDTGYHRRIKTREAEHYALFGGNDVAVAPILPAAIQKVIFICPIYKNYPQIVSALLCQTYPHWELHLIHDGPGKIDLPDDPRIVYTETMQRVGNWGHSIRSTYLQSLKDKSDYIIISNPDNYYMPTYIEKAISVFNKQPGAVAVYCSQIIHNYTDWKVMNCRLERGFIDCGQVMVRAKEAGAVGFNSNEHSADWFYFNDIANRYGADKFVSFPGVHFVHN